MSTENPVTLRTPFPPDQVGKLPRITCGQCRDSKSKVCDKHKKSKCQACDNWITDAHTHLDYVGHAAVTARLLDVDPGWVWEPVAFDEAGLPLLDRFGGLWVRLTVGGVTRLGYGHADGGAGGDAVKVAIGDAIRNAAMRFGVALDLWSKSDLHAPPVDDAGGSRPARAPRSPKKPDGAPTPRSDPQREAKKRLVASLGGDATEAGRVWASVVGDGVYDPGVHDIGLAAAVKRWEHESRPFTDTDPETG